MSNFGALVPLVLMLPPGLWDDRRTSPFRWLQEDTLVRLLIRVYRGPERNCALPTLASLLLPPQANPTVMDCPMSVPVED